MSISIDNWMYILFLVNIILGNYLLKRFCGVGFFAELPTFDTKIKRFFANTYQIWLAVVAGAITYACTLLITSF